MKNKVIKAESKALISGKRGKALLIVLFGILFCAVMTAIIFGAIFISRVFKDFGVGVTIASAAVLIFLSLITLCVYSSAAIGEKAWYGGLTGNKRNCARRLFFWFRPKNAFRALWFNVLLFLIKTMWAIVFFFRQLFFFGRCIISPPREDLNCICSFHSQSAAFCLLSAVWYSIL